MGFKTQVLTDLSDMMSVDVFAESITYDGTAITAIVDYEGDVERNERGATKGPDSAKILVKTTDVSQVNQAAPVMIGTANWMVDAELKSDNDVREIRIHSANTVTIARGAQTCTALAVIRETVRTRYDFQGNEIETVAREYGIRASAYAPTGTASTPAQGDRITDNEGTFEVMSVEGKAHYHYRNRSREQLIVRTREV